MITRLMYTIHRVLDTLFSILFLVWFLSAFVMMYHGFPCASQIEKLEKPEPLSPSSPFVGEITSRLPEDEKMKGIQIDRYLGQAVFHIRADKSEYNLSADPAQVLPSVDGSRIRRTAFLWCSAPVERIDTLNRLDQWIPFGSLKEEFPIHKFHFADAERRQLYIGSQGGEVLQFTTRSERFWTWLGAIPHWVYFTWLRQDAALWSVTVIWLSGVGCLVAIAELWVGIDIWRRSRKQGKSSSPYRKKWYHWHYMTGTVLGLFMLTFCFGGMMSLAEVPSWISKPVLDKNPTREMKKGAPRLEQYVLDYRRILTEYPDIRQIEWSNFRSQPYHTVKRSEGDLYIGALDSLSRPPKLDEKQITDAVRAIHGDGAQLHAALINKFETYYRDTTRMYRNRSLLPVWKITVGDADKSCYYIHPETGIVQYVNDTARWKYWMYTALHRLRIQGLNSSPIFRKTVLRVLLLGGTVCSLNGVVLGVRYIERKCRKKIKR